MENQKKYKLYNKLGLSEEFIPNQFNSELCVDWNDLKRELTSLKEKEVIEEIKNTTYITEGMTP